jgi:iron only hydrogenase large subunit-like protein
MIATAMAVKKLYGKDCGVVFIGPCIAKKKEARDPEVIGWVDEVITFKESRKLRKDMGIEACRDGTVKF